MELVSNFLVDSYQLQLLLVTGFVAYYLIEVVRKPKVSAREGPYRDFLLRNMPCLHKRYWPTFWCIEGRIQTLFGSVLRDQIIPRIQYRREILTLSDGGQVALDWMDENCAPDSPIVVILPGLTGASNADYIRSLVSSVHKVGIRIVVFNNRGFFVPLKTARLYCAANCDDLREVVRHVRAQNPDSKLGATGISLGGVILGNYLSQHSEEASELLRAAQIISSPWQIPKGMLHLEKPIFNHLLQRGLAARMVKMMSSPEYSIFHGDDHPWDLQRALQSKHVREFDSHFTSKLFGYESVDHYYESASLHDKVRDIRVPLLCLNAADDPFQPEELLPLGEFEGHETGTVAMVVTARGGHIGFLEGVLPTSREQYIGKVFREFFSAVFFDSAFDKIANK